MSLPELIDYQDREIKQLKDRMEELEAEKKVLLIMIDVYKAETGGMRGEIEEIVALKDKLQEAEKVIEYVAEGLEESYSCDAQSYLDKHKAKEDE